MMEKELIYQITDIIETSEIYASVSALKVGREQFAADLKARIEANGMKRRQMYLYISEIKHIIDETLNAK